jgi:hypothetical protein
LSVDRERVGNTAGRDPAERLERRIPDLSVIAALLSQFGQKSTNVDRARARDRLALRGGPTRRATSASDRLSSSSCSISR